MDQVKIIRAFQIFGNLGTFLRKCAIRVLCIGPVPQHIAFIMDGNRRFAKKWNLLEGTGHKIGYWNLMSMLQYCCELGVKYVTVYAFSIDNFKRRPEEVQSVMELIQESVEELIKEDSMVNRYGIRVYFVGNLKLLNESVRLAAGKAMAATASNSKAVLSICVAYASTGEIVHAVQESCNEKRDKLKDLDASGGGYGLIGLGGNETNQGEELISLIDVEKHMYMSVAPDPDILIRTSGETRLSNFLLWQTATCHLYSPSALWPEFGFRHLFWAVLNFQRNLVYFQQRKSVLQASQVDTT